MRWPEKSRESPSLRVIGEEQQEEDVMKDARKRIKSGITYANKSKNTT